MFVRLQILWVGLIFFFPIAREKMTRSLLKARIQCSHPTHSWKMDESVYKGKCHTHLWAIKRKRRNGVDMAMNKYDRLHLPVERRWLTAVSSSLGLIQSRLLPHHWARNDSPRVNRSLYHKHSKWHFWRSRNLPHLYPLERMTKNPLKPKYFSFQVFLRERLSWGATTELNGK